MNEYKKIHVRGNSMSVTILPEWIKANKIIKGAWVKMDIKGDKLIIEKVDKKK